MQTKGTDTIVDYKEGEDTIQLLSKPTKQGKKNTNSYYYKNAEGTVIVNNGLDKTITTVVSGVDNNIATNNDELWGVSNKQDIFLFNGGDDTIHNYEANDAIDFSGYLLSDLSIMLVVKDNDLVFTFDKSNSLTISDVVGSGTAVTFTDGTTYSYNGKKYTKN